MQREKRTTATKLERLLQEATDRDGNSPQSAKKTQRCQRCRVQSNQVPRRVISKNILGSANAILERQESNEVAPCDDQVRPKLQVHLFSCLPCCQKAMGISHYHQREHSGTIPTVEVVNVVNLIDKQKYLLCRRW